MASIRKANKQAKKEGRVWVEPEKLKRRKLQKQVQQQVDIVNKRLRRLDKKGYYNSFSSKKLFERLDSSKFNALAASADDTKVDVVVKGVKTLLKSAIFWHIKKTIVTITKRLYHNIFKNTSIFCFIIYILWP